MEFLRKLVYNRPNFTKNFMEFENVGPISEEEEEEENAEEEEDDGECEIENIGLTNYARMPSSPSSYSTCSTMSAASTTKLTCGNCGLREKDTLLQCGHSTCSFCFEQMKNERKEQCCKIKGKNKRAKEEKKLKCPFPKCGMQINDIGHKINFDL